MHLVTHMQVEHLWVGQRVLTANDEGFVGLLTVKSVELASYGENIYSVLFQNDEEMELHGLTKVLVG